MLGEEGDGCLGELMELPIGRSSEELTEEMLLKKTEKNRKRRIAAQKRKEKRKVGWACLLPQWPFTQIILLRLRLSGNYWKSNVQRRRMKKRYYILTHVYSGHKCDASPAQFMRNLLIWDDWVVLWFQFSIFNIKDHISGGGGRIIGSPTYYDQLFSIQPRPVQKRSAPCVSYCSKKDEKGRVTSNLSLPHGADLPMLPEK